MSRQVLAAAGLMLAICPAAAAAQDSAGTESPLPLSTGLRVEALIGYDHASFDSVLDGDGLLYGLGIGYDLALGQVRLGLGAEFALSRRTFVKAEYRFTNYEFSSGFNRHQAVMGFGFRF